VTGLFLPRLKLFIQVFLQSLSERSLLGSFFCGKKLFRSARSTPAQKRIEGRDYRRTVNDIPAAELIVQSTKETLQKGGRWFKSIQKYKFMA
jgi:hypothetical protein